MDKLKSLHANYQVHRSISQLAIENEKIRKQYSVRTNQYYKELLELYDYMLNILKIDELNFDTIFKSLAQIANQNTNEEIQKLNKFLKLGVFSKTLGLSSKNYFENFEDNEILKNYLNLYEKLTSIRDFLLGKNSEEKYDLLLEAGTKYFRKDGKQHQLYTFKENGVTFKFLTDEKCIRVDKKGQITINITQAKLKEFYDKGLLQEFHGENLGLETFLTEEQRKKGIFTKELFHTTMAAKLGMTQRGRELMEDKSNNIGWDFQFYRELSSGENDPRSIAAKIDELQYENLSTFAGWDSAYGQEKFIRADKGKIELASMFNIMTSARSFLPYLNPQQQLEQSNLPDLLVDDSTFINYIASDIMRGAYQPGQVLDAENYNFFF